TIEINQYVAAHDQIDALHERHAGIVEQVQSLETDARLHFRIDLQQLTAGREIFLPEILREISSAVVSVYPLLGLRDRTFIQVRSGDLKRPTLESEPGWDRAAPQVAQPSSVWIASCSLCESLCYRITS